MLGMQCPLPSRCKRHLLGGVTRGRREGTPGAGQEGRGGPPEAPGNPFTCRLMTVACAFTRIMLGRISRETCELGACGQATRGCVAVVQATGTGITKEL